MKRGAAREEDGHHTIARGFTTPCAPVAQSPSLSPHLQSMEMLMTLSIESLIRNNFPSIDYTAKSSLLQILEPHEQFFHISQQSAKMSIDHSRRTRLSNELKRRADIEHYRDSSVKPTSLHQDGVNIEHVTLTMEVTYSDYEEMFTKRTLGSTTESCANIMFETNTIIQFPDRDENNPDFIHQVTITGNLADVEEARIRLRKFCPVVLMFAVSERLRDDVAIVGLNQWIKEKTDDGSINFPTVIIQALPQSMSASFKDPVIRISGRIGDEHLLLQTCERLRELLFVPEVADKVSFSTHMEVPASQRSQLVGTPDGAQLLVISRFTKALLHFPSHSDESSQTLFFYFTGQPEAVLKARRFVQGLLPMQLCFHAGSEDLRARIEAENRMIKFYDEVLRVTVRVVPSDLESLSVLPGDQMRHYISLRTNEYNVGALYAVMRRVLKHGDKIPMVTPTDYAEMLPLVPDLIKHACEVNVKCRLEPCALDLSTLSSIHSPPVSSSSHSLAGNVANHGDAADRQLAESVETSISTAERVSSASISRNKLDIPVDRNYSTHSNKAENGTSLRVYSATSRSRHSSPQNHCFERYSSRHIDKEITRPGKDLLPLARPRVYYNERRGSSFRSNRGTNANSKHHLALRCREEINRSTEGRFPRNQSNPHNENCSHTVEDGFNLHQKGNNGCDRFLHGMTESPSSTEWRVSQSRTPESFYSYAAKTNFSQRPRVAKVELQRRIKEEHVFNEQREFHRRPNRRMDVMDLIKLASAEDSDRRKTPVEESSSILDSGDALTSDAVVGADVVDAGNAVHESVNLSCFENQFLSVLQNQSSQRSVQ